MDDPAMLLASLIWTGMLGLAVGNYATSWVHRMPKRESTFTRHPYCSTCQTPLTPRDLFPVLSYVTLRGRCRYCEAAIPPIYTWIELYCALIFMLGVASYGFNEAYMYVVLGGTLALVYWGLEYCHRVVSDHALLGLAGAGLLYRMAMDGSSYDALQGAIWGGVITAMWWRMRRKLDTPDGDPVPLYVKLAATAGLWCGSFGLLVMVTLWLAIEGSLRLLASLRGKVRPSPHTAAFSLALCLLMLYPQIVENARAGLLGQMRQVAPPIAMQEQQPAPVAEEATPDAP